MTAQNIALERGSETWSLWLGWVVASAVAGAILGTTVRALLAWMGAKPGQLLGGVAGEALVGFLALGGVVGGMGLAQSLILRRHVEWANWWILSSVVAGAVAGAITLGVWKAIAVGASGQEGLAAFSGVALGLATFWGLQWMILRPHLDGAAWLAASGVAGLIAAGLLGGVVASLIGVAAEETTFGALFGAFYGASTGAAVASLLQRAH